MKHVKGITIGFAIFIAFMLGGWTATEADMKALGLDDAEYNIVQKWLTQGTVAVVTTAGVLGVTLPTQKKEEPVAE